MPAFRVYWTSLIISQSRCCCCCFCCSIIVHLERQFCCCCCCCFCLCWLHGSRPGLIAAAWISTQNCCSLHWDATSANCFVATSGRSSAKFKTFEVFFRYWGARNSVSWPKMSANMRKNWGKLCKLFLRSCFTLLLNCGGKAKLNNLKQSKRTYSNLPKFYYIVC